MHLYKYCLYFGENIMHSKRHKYAEVHEMGILLNHPDLWKKDFQMESNSVFQSYGGKKEYGNHFLEIAKGREKVKL